MLLTVNINNQKTDIGIFDNNKLIITGNIRCFQGTKYEIACKLKDLFNLFGIDHTSIDDSIISSVVPALTPIYTEGIELLIGANPILVGPGIKTGINIVIDNPTELGAELVCASVYAIEKYKHKVLLINMSTANTITIIDDCCKLIGVVILPGVEESLKTLYSSSALLPQISIKKTDKIFGTNSAKSMESGIYFGTIFQIQGMIEKITEELGYQTNIMLTGDIGEVFIDALESDIDYDRDIILKGLNILYNKNKKLR